MAKIRGAEWPSPKQSGRVNPGREYADRLVQAHRVLTNGSEGRARSGRPLRAWSSRWASG